jgi:transcriptional regulator with XRE-family HTH domain
VSEEKTTTVIDRKLGARVRARRREIGVSQEQLAETLGVTFQQVQKYEKGVNRMAATRLFAIAIALDMPVHQFFEGMQSAEGARRGKDRAVANAVNEVMSTPEGAQLLRMFASINNLKIRRRVVDLVRVMLED